MEIQNLSRIEISNRLIDLGQRLSGIVAEFSALTLAHDDCDGDEKEKVNELLQSAHRQMFALAQQLQLGSAMNGEPTPPPSLAMAA